MFSTLFRHSLRYALRQRMLLFWSLAFPLILATFFSLAFSQLYQAEQIGPAIPIAYVEAKEPNPLYDTLGILRGIKTGPDKVPMFDIQTVSLEEARLAVAEDRVAAAVLAGEPPQLMARKISVNQVVVKQVLDAVATVKEAAFGLIRAGAPTSPELISKELNLANYTQPQAFRKDRMNLDIIYFFALFAMTCLGASQAGAMAFIQQQANKSAEGARASVSAASKWLRVSAWGLASYLVQCVLTLIVLAYTTLVLGKFFGDSLGLITLLLCLGTLTGFLMGMALACVVRGSLNTVMGLTAGLYLFSCFLAGLMSDQVKRMVDTSLPLIAAINPGTMIVNSLYSLYYYQSFDARYALYLLAACLVFAAITALTLRRRYHDSI